MYQWADAGPGAPQTAAGSVVPPGGRGGIRQADQKHSLGAGPGADLDLTSSSSFFTRCSRSQSSGLGSSWLSSSHLRRLLA